MRPAVQCRPGEIGSNSFFVPQDGLFDPAGCWSRLEPILVGHADNGRLGLEIIAGQVRDNDLVAS